VHFNLQKQSKNKHFYDDKTKNLHFKKKKIKFDYTKNRKDAEQKHLSMTINNIVIPESFCPESIPL